MELFRNTCPRNCYGTCSIISYVENGKLIKVTGDPKHGFTQGRLCPKGYAYTQYVYNSSRLKYPIIQTPRGSGNWQRISWDEAYSIIAEKMIELYSRYGSNLASGYNKFSGNIGLLHYAVEGMFNSIGPHTKPVGDLCSSSGGAALKKTIGDVISPIPEKMAQAKLIVIWGANPAATNVQQMKYIFQAKQNGATVVVIDPIFSETAAKADIYIQNKPGTDALLAYGIAKIMIEKECYEKEYVETNSQGWAEFKHYLINEVNFPDICHVTGVQFEVMKELASLFSTIKPGVTWSGLGVQRNKNGEIGIQAILSLSAMSGHFCEQYSGTYYTHADISHFPLTLLNHPEKEHCFVKKSRSVSHIDFAAQAKALNDPPLKLLWIASRSPLSQDQNIQAWKELFNSLELIVTVDLFMNETTKHSDIVLPAASLFEEEDLHVGYWHHWISINQKAIDPFFEAKSDLQIARELTKKLNELSPGFSDFHYELEPIDWIKAELTPHIKQLYSLDSYEDLVSSPHPRIDDYDKRKSKEFHFIKPINKANLYDDQTNEGAVYPFRLLSPQSLLKIHSQFATLSWLHPEREITVIEINDIVAENLGIHDETMVTVFNDYGSIEAKAVINADLPQEIIVVNQAGEKGINQLIGDTTKDSDEESSINFYDTYVAIKN
ncbi:molybdopterin-dependent oxidoreductase [Calidifontibacillus oryziterrae]|uniref:molybdopterin-dependent oxidoreductase n=1 Tax=Calidifontibacillus oryziterrae TaxID=1191699 RepID=UPI000314D1D3|nr:molybdopterin-dependent oxidoreductase [Calidifontibacillus oryziterrae]